MNFCLQGMDSTALFVTIIPVLIYEKKLNIFFVTSRHLNIIEDINQPAVNGDIQFYCVYE